MLKMLEAEFKKIKRQKFILLTVLAACLFPIPLTIVIVHSKLNYDTLLMFVMEFGFFLVLPIVLGIIASILFRMENENGTLKTLSVIPVPRWKLLGAKVIIIYILAIFYGVAAIGATMIGGLFTGTISDIPLKLAISLSMSVLIATASLPMIAAAVAEKFHIADTMFCYLCSCQFCIFCYAVESSSSIDFIVSMQSAFYNGKSRTHGNGGECAELGTASISLYPFSYWDGNCVHGIVGIYLSETGGVMR